MSTGGLAVRADGYRIGMDAEDAASAAEFVIHGTKIDLLDAKLSKKRRAHDAGLDCDVEDTLSND
jgi:hypothetical protein